MSLMAVKLLRDEVVCYSPYKSVTYSKGKLQLVAILDM